MLKVLIAGFQSSFIVGLIYGIGTIGLSLIYRYLKFPDLTTFMSISVGSVAVIIFTNSFGIFIGILSGCLLGGVLGLVTALQITHAKIPPILAGIITSTAGMSLGYFIS